MKKMILFVLTVLMLTACNGGETSAEGPQVTMPVDDSTDATTETPANPNGFTEEQIRSDWELPPTPDENDPDYNTIKGVVYTGEITNDQAARSDWIITNAIATYPDKREFDLLNKGAVNSNQMIEAYESGDDARLKELFDEYRAISSCYGYYYYESGNSKLLFSPGEDNSARLNYEEEISNRLDLLDEETLSLPTRAEDKINCPKFINQ